jgi:hypothetical protein
MLDQILKLSEILDTDLKGVNILAKLLLVGYLTIVELPLFYQEIFFNFITKLQDVFRASKDLPSFVQIFIIKLIAITFKNAIDLCDFIDTFLYSLQILRYLFYLIHNLLKFLNVFWLEGNCKS